MTTMNSGLTRRHFLKTTIAAVGAATLPMVGARVQATAKYTRYNVMSDGGKKALASYAKGVDAMLNLPADHPQNWFRHAFVHLMDCPHGNWWFYVWHRGFVGYFEEAIRNLSGDDSFAMPYWDWTTLPQIPDSMFDGVLTPQSMTFEPYTRNLAVFTSFIQPELTKYWNNLSPAQRAQLNVRGYKEFVDMWNDVTGNGVSGNVCFANTCGSRYLTRDNPKLDAKTAFDSSPFIIYSGLLPIEFYNPNVYLSFNSSKTPSHNTAPGKDSFSVLEGYPHNKIHNYIGGVGPLGPGPYGNMTNFLSPVDPIFYLHHSNMDRLWDVWTRKQKALNLPYLPPAAELKTLSDEPFLFYVNGKGEYVGPSHAGEYLSTERFQYDYEPGFGENIIQVPSAGLLHKQPTAPVNGVLKGNTASFVVPSGQIKNNLASELGASLVAEITLARPSATSPGREFDVIVGAPPDVTQVEADSPYYAGTIAFFGGKMNMEGMSSDVTFAVPMPKVAAAYRNLAAAANAPVSIRVVPSNGYGGKAPALKAASIRAR
jgi:tyrosinase